MNSQPQFERLISVDDDELDNSTLNGLDEAKLLESCNVPIIPPSNIFNQNNLKKTKEFTGENLPSTMYSFSFNGRHLRANHDQLKYLSLITLVFQSAALNITMRAANTQPEKFSNGIVVTVAEVMKFVICLLFIWHEDDYCIERTYQSFKHNIIYNYIDTLKVAIPSLVYYTQNNLLYVASSHLDAATGQVIYQLKILTTAIFSVTLLGKKLSLSQWISLFVLFSGVAIIERLAILESNATKINSDNKISNFTTPDDVNVRSQPHVDNPTLGLISVVLACCLSGFAGVYFEKILKGSPVSLWIRNIQLSLMSIPFGLIQVIFIDRNEILKNGIWYGFTPLTWFCIVLQVIGGLLVALVVKFANNILKGFATSLAIVVSTIASMIFFQFHLTPGFVIGASLVIGATMMYNRQ